VELYVHKFWRKIFSDFRILTHSLFALYTSNMAAWFSAKFDDVTAPYVYVKMMLGK